jgi:LPS O-antigen subunit length determinant protein (WzzB/FepE family)
MGQLMRPNVTDPPPTQKVEVEPIKSKNKGGITVASFSKTEILTLVVFIIVLLLIGSSIGYYIRTIVYNPPTTPLITYQNKLQQKIVSIDTLITKEQSHEDIDDERIQRLERNRKIVAETLTNYIYFQKTNDILIDTYIDNQTVYLKTNGIFLNKTK